MSHPCPECGGPSINTIEADGTAWCGRCVMALVRDVHGDTFAEVFFGAEDGSELAHLEDDELYAACRTNGKRATKRQMEAMHEALVRIVEEVAPCTVRQVYYQATTHGVVDKTEAGYDRVQRALVDLRRSSRIPYRKITDNTRWQIKPATYGGLKDALEETARLYRRAVWSDVDAYVELWLEKDALAGVVQPVTAKFDVPLMVARGFSSLSFLHAAGEDIAALDKPAHIYHTSATMTLQGYVQAKRSRNRCVILHRRRKFISSVLPCSPSRSATGNFHPVRPRPAIAERRRSVMPKA
jgi:hypothetical protein